jgi:hypothetical protein
MTTMDEVAAGTEERGTQQKPATAARMYDYYLGGIHNFPADREAARKVLALFPDIPAAARANRAFLRRAVRHLTGSGIRQFLDIGSGIPTEGNVHEIAQQAVPDARVVYLDIDPIAVAESVEILEGNEYATAILADLRSPQEILDHPEVRAMLDPGRPIGLLLGAVLNFVPEDTEAYAVVTQLLAPLAAGSYLVISHGANESFAPSAGNLEVAQDLYRRQTTTPYKLRTRAEVERFFTGVELLEPGVTWVPEWRPVPGEPDDFAGDPRLSGSWAGMGRKN